jgi:hypothetical protein
MTDHQMNVENRNIEIIGSIDEKLKKIDLWPTLLPRFSTYDRQEHDFRPTAIDFRPAENRLMTGKKTTYDRQGVSRFINNNGMFESCQHPYNLSLTFL